MRPTEVKSHHSVYLSGRSLCLETETWVGVLVLPLWYLTDIGGVTYKPQFSHLQKGTVSPISRKGCKDPMGYAACTSALYNLTGYVNSVWWKARPTTPLLFFSLLKRPEKQRWTLGMFVLPPCRLGSLLLKILSFLFLRTGEEGVGLGVGEPSLVLTTSRLGYTSLLSAEDKTQKERREK